MSEGLNVHFEVDDKSILQDQQVVSAWKAEFEPATDAATAITRTEVFEKTPHAFGMLRNSLGTRTVVFATSIHGSVLTPSPYAAPVEFGSKPHWAPIGPLLLWSQRKTGDTRAAYMAQRAIARRGGRAHHMFRDGWKVAKPYVERLFDGAFTKFMKRLGRP